MAKFYGAIGFGESVETVPGVWEDLITERNYYGDVVRNTLKVKEGEAIELDNIELFGGEACLTERFPGSVAQSGQLAKSSVADPIGL